MRSLNADFFSFCAWAAGRGLRLFRDAAIPATLAIGIGAGSVLAAEADYQLAPGDVVEFDFLDDEELPRQLTIATDGQVQVPLLGGLRIAGQTVAGALDEIRARFRERNLLLDPKVTLSVAIYRPIYVIGDVKTPGSFPFQALLTVEKAVGLAGGPLTLAGDVEDRVIARSRMAGDLERVRAELARESVAIAQATAQLSERTAIDDNDIPQNARPYLDASLVGSLKEVGNRFLDVEHRAFETQRSLLSDAITEAGHQAQVLEELVKNQKSTIQSSQEQIKRTEALFKKGLTLANEMSALQRQLTSDEGRLLSIYAQISDARTNVSAMKRQLAQIGEQRKQDALLLIQDKKVLIEKLLSEQRSTEEQLYLLTNLMSDEARQSREVALDYTIRRTTMTGSQDIAATNLSMVMPGDLVLVTIRRPNAKASALQQ